MRLFIERLRFAYKVLFSKTHYRWLQDSLSELQKIRPTAAKWEKIESLLKSHFGSAVRYSVEKVSNDPSFHLTKDHFFKRREAEEWAGHYLRELGIPYSAWEINFLIELVVGMKKGRL